MAVALFDFDDVRVRLGDHDALSGLTACLPRGGVTVISGASGSGKSTVLRLCNRLEVPTSGTVRFLGGDIVAEDPVALRRRVGMVFQRPTPFEGTVLDNLRVARADISDDDATELLATVSLPPEMLERTATELSGGEAQRMCLARTLATGCEVVLADECTSSLDHGATLVVEATARRLADGGRSVVWVTHDTAQRDRLADHELVLDGGRRAE